MKEDEPHKYDVIPIVTYLICLVTLIFGYYFSLIGQHYLNLLILGLNIIIPMFLLLNYFKRLRIGTIFISWIVLGIIHAISTYSFKQSQDFHGVNGNYASAYLIIIITLATLFLLRIISAYVFGQEFISAAYFSPTDRRKKKPIDYMLTIAGLILIGIYIVCSN